MTATASGRSSSIARSSRSVLPGADRDVREPDPLHRVERGPGHPRPGAVGRDDPLPGAHARARVAARGARSPSSPGRPRSAGCRRGCRWCRWSSRCGRCLSARRRGGCRSGSPSWCCRGAPAWSSAAAARSRPGRRRPRPPRSLPRVSFSPVERRALEQVGELLAIAVGVEGLLLSPRPRLDLGLEHQLESSAAGLSTPAASNASP